MRSPRPQGSSPRSCQPPPSALPPWASRPAWSRTWRRRTRRGTDVRHQTAEDVICYLREQQVVLTYDPATETLRAGTGTAAKTITLKAS
jgi:hypothetical protein